MSSSLATPAESISELGFYTLAGHAEQPRNLLAEVRAAEAMGLGHVFISERWNTKEAATLSGAAGAVRTESPSRPRQPTTSPGIRSSPPPTR